MKFPFQDIIAGRIIPEALAFCRNFAESVRSGAFRRGLRLWLSANGVFAAISLALAACLYFWIRGKVSYNGSRPVPVEVAIDGVVSPRMIHVYVRGTENDVRKFEAGTAPIRLAIPTEIMSASNRTVKIRVHKRKDIPGIRELGLLVTGISSDFVTVTADDRVGDVQFDIDPPKLEGRPLHADATVEIEPMSASLHGGLNFLESQQETVRLQLKPIDVENVSQSFDKDCEIILPDKLAAATNVTVYPRTVRARVKVVPRAGTRTIESIPIRLSVTPGIPLPSGFEVRPAMVAAKITGHELSVSALSNTMINAYAEIDNIAMIDYTPSATNILPVRLEFPPDKVIWRAEPDPAEISIVMPAPPPEAKSIPDEGQAVAKMAETQEQADGAVEKPETEAAPEAEKMEDKTAPDKHDEKQQE